MDAKQLVASLVGSIAWPLAVFAIALLFRRQIAALLAAPIKRLKAGPVELEFERVLPTVQEALDMEFEHDGSEQEEAVGSLDPKATEPRRGPPSLLAKAAEKFSGMSARKQLGGVARTAPGAAVLAAHAWVEEVLWFLLERTGEPAARRRRGARGMADLLEMHKVIGPNVERAIGELTDLRDRVGQGVEEPTATAALSYLDLVDEVIAAILSGSGRTSS